METAWLIFATAFYTTIAIRVIVVTYRVEAACWAVMLGAIWPATGLVVGVGTILGAGPSIYDRDRHPLTEAAGQS